ncbi:uncharacterized protein LOC133316095 [Gastrolobium bilobum]|uniref:uncharacterized protein LOC133316095 n=1 Tax=Gastrolobium bilobum TaxID=150636 RepID=UPI002AB1AB99|nr:uncharacterized protein LOC133316095 [Gastrolobium bilobum]
MDPSQIKKIQAMNKYKKRQFLDNLYFYFLTALTCSLFCCITLCLPYLSSLVRVFFLVYYEEYIKSKQTKKLQIQTLEINKAKTFEKHVAENVDMTGVGGLNKLDLKGKGWVKKATEDWPAKEENNLDGEDQQSLFSSSDELNKRADDFIARVNRQRRLELSLMQYGSY